MAADDTGGLRLVLVNRCLLSMAALAMRTVLTAEALAQDVALLPVQRTMVEDG